MTSDTVMRLDERPDRLLVIGGGFIGCEMGHVFSALGSEVTILTRGAGLLTAEDDAVTQAVTARYRERGAVHTGVLDPVFTPGRDGFTATFRDADGEHAVEADLVLVAVGRTSNADTLDLPTGGIEVGADGRPVVDAQQRTTSPGVWALGDLSSQHWLKHIANAEARTVAHNIRNPDAQVATALPNVPSAVFGDPQVASVGARERDLVADGTPHLVARRDYGSTAYGWAMEDTTSFVKVLVDPASRLLLGVHVVGPNASLVAQPLVQAMALGNTVDEVARDVVYIHPALSEVVENVLLEVPAP